MDVFSHNCVNGSSQFQGIDFGQYYSPVAHVDSFCTNIDITDIQRLNEEIFSISNALQNTNVPINEIFCVIPPPHYLDWFEKSDPNVPINQDVGPFFSNEQMEFRY